jgi:2-oxoglutarate ferredoxin oxidoreductase subunit alpha
MKKLLQGNEAVVEGALAAGCRFFAGYPITPASEILEAMSYKMPDAGGTFIQMEDEIASMGAVIGASLAGKKAMTATSGPGFSLLQENLGFASIAEVPCVVVDVMRGGPSTGIPTAPSQGDVLQARWGTHGDHPVIVMAPADTMECFMLTVDAFNFAEKYRVPVVLLLDEVVAHTREVIEIPKNYEVIDRIKPSVPREWHIPYEDSSTGVSPMASFGDGYRHHVTGLVHDVRGFPTQRPDEVDAFVKRLDRKLLEAYDEIVQSSFYMMDDAEIAIIAYGSVTRPAAEAAERARAVNCKVGLAQLQTLFPYDKPMLREILKQCRAVLVPEMNMGQMSLVIKRLNEFDCYVERFGKVDGQFITPDEIYQRILRL